MTEITSTPGVQGGEPCVAGTRIPVRSIVSAQRCYEGDPAGFYSYTDGIRLSRDDVAYALAWYAEHREQVDALIEDQEQALEELIARG